MAITLTVFFSSINTDEVEFAFFNGADATPLERGTSPIPILVARASALQAMSTTIVLPGEMITSRSVRIPRGSRKQLEKALPYLLEDHLACSPDIIHAAPAAPSESGDVVVLVIGKALLESILEYFTQGGLRCDRLIPDYLMLPSGEKPCVVRQQDRAIIRFTDGTGMAIPASVLPLPAGDQWEIMDSEEVLHPASSIPEGYNLLQGAYTPRSARHPSKYLKATLLVLALGALLHIAYFISTGLYFHRLGDAAHLQAEQTYRALFPDEQRVVNVRRQLEGRLLESNPNKGTDSFLDLVGGLADATSADPSAVARVKHLNFNRQRAQLLAELDVNGLADLQRLTALLAERGISADVLGAGKSDQGVSARVTLTRKSQQ